MTDALTELLATDPQAARCYAFLTGDELTLDALCACYGGASETPTEFEEAAYRYLTGVEYAEESEGEQLSRIAGVPEESVEVALNLPTSSTSADADAEREELWNAWRAWSMA